MNRLALLSFLFDVLVVAVGHVLLETYQFLQQCLTCKPVFDSRSLL